MFLPLYGIGDVLRSTPAVRNLKAREYARHFSLGKMAEEYEKYLLGTVRETSGEKR